MSASAMFPILIIDPSLFKPEPKQEFKSTVVVHFRPVKGNGNVRCLNGNAHARDTSDINEVTCPLCLDKSTAFKFWQAVRLKEHNRLKTMFPNGYVPYTND